jgi:hypothetical protein
MKSNGVRERGLALQRQVTVWVIAVSTVLAGIFAGVAAATAPGHKLVQRIVGDSSSTSGSQEQSSEDESDDGGTPLAPVQVPSQTSQPPVASSGGS